MQDRLTALRDGSGINPFDDEPVDTRDFDVENPQDKPDTASVDALVARFSPVQAHIAAIEAAARDVHALHRESDTATDEAAHQALLRRLDDIMSNARREGKLASVQLKEIESDLQKDVARSDNPFAQSASQLMAQNLLRTNRHHLMEVLTDFNRESEQFRAALKDKIRRLARVVFADASEDEIEQIADSDNPMQLITKQLVSDGSFFPHFHFKLYTHRTHSGPGPGGLHRAEARVDAANRALCARAGGAV
ncbi:MAG: hypothetical protein MHM6MM_008129 [Cercozoa sp. M6MM]